LLFSAAHQQSCSSPVATTIKYLKKTTSGAADIGLGTTIKNPRRTTGAAAGNGLNTTLNYLRDAAVSGQAQRSSFFDAQRAPPRVRPRKHD